MCMLSTLLTRMEIKTPIFHVTNSMTMLAFPNLMKIWSKWRWNFLTKTSTLELDRFGIIRKVKHRFIVISKANFMLVLVDFVCDLVLVLRVVVVSYHLSLLVGSVGLSLDIFLVGLVFDHLTICTYTFDNSKYSLFCLWKKEVGNLIESCV